MDQGESTGQTDVKDNPAAAAKQALSDHLHDLSGQPTPPSDKASGPADARPGAGGGPVYDSGATFSTDAVGMSEDTLKQSAAQLRQSVGNLDTQSTLNLILTTPRQNRAELEALYQAKTHHSLRDDLHLMGMDNAAKALDSKSPTDDTAARVSTDLQRLSHLDKGSSERGPLEKDLRDTIRTLNASQLSDLETTLKAGNQGKGLKDILAEGHISQASRQALAIYQKGSDQLSDEDRVKIAQIATSPPVENKQTALDLLSAALSGDQGAAAREKFRQAGGGKSIETVFKDHDLSTARDLVAFGNDGPTRVADYHSNIGADKGLENVLNHMTEGEHQMFDRGEHLAAGDAAHSKKFSDPRDQEAFDYYQKMHFALSDSTFAGLSPARWGGPESGARLAKLTEWEDIAAHGHRTLIGQLAAQRNAYVSDDPSKFMTTLHSGTGEDWDRMHNDPVYQAKMQKLIGTLDYGDRLLANREIQRVYTDSANPQAFEQNKKLQLEDLNRSFGLSKADDATVMSTISRSTAAEWKSMDGQDQELLKARVEQLPDGAKQATREMLAALQRGEDAKPGLKEQIYMDQLRGKSPLAVAHDLQQAANQDPKLYDRLYAGQEGALEKAIRSAMGSDLAYQKYGKTLIEHKGLTMASVIEANTQRGVTNHVDAAAVYNDISLLTPADRQKLVAAQAGAQHNDTQARAYLDQALAGLSPQQRQIALGIASNTDGRPSLADRMRASLNGDDKNLSSDITNLETKGRDAKVATVQEYSRKYGSFMIADVSSKGNETDKAALTRALPLPVEDLYRVHQQALHDASVGMISQSNMASQSDRLTEGYRSYNTVPGLQEDEKSILGILNDSSTAVRDHDAAKQEKAEKVAEKIVDAASLAVPAGGLGIKGVLYAAAAGAAMRPMVEAAVTGKHIEGPQMAGLLGAGAIDGTLSVLGPAEVRGIAERLTANTFKALPGCLAETAAKDALSQEAMRSLEQEVKHEMVTRGTVSTAELDRMVGKHVSDPEKRRLVVDAIEQEHNRLEQVEEHDQAKRTLVPGLMKDAKVTEHLRAANGNIEGSPVINPFKGSDNCTACVGATLRSAGEGQVTDVNALYDLPSGTGKVGQAVPDSYKNEAGYIAYMERAAGLDPEGQGLQAIMLPKSDRGVPNFEKLPAGHYAITFNLNAAEKADRHVIYAEKLGDGSMYFYDPQSHQVYDPKLVKKLFSPANADVDRFPQFYRADMPGSPVPQSLADSVPGKVRPEDYASWFKPPPEVPQGALCRPEVWTRLSSGQQAAMKEMDALRASGQITGLTDAEFEGMSIRWDLEKNRAKWQGEAGKKAFADWYLAQVRAKTPV